MHTKIVGNTVAGTIISLTALMFAIAASIFLAVSNAASQGSVIWVLVIPVVIAGVPVVVPGRYKIGTLVVCAVFMIGWIIVILASLGPYFVPSFATLVAAAVWYLVSSKKHKQEQRRLAER